MNYGVDIIMIHTILHRLERADVSLDKGEIIVLPHALDIFQRGADLKAIEADHVIRALVQSREFADHP